MAKKKRKGEKEEGKQKRITTGTKFFVFFRLSNFFFRRRNVDHLYTFGSAIFFFFLCKDSSNISSADVMFIATINYD
jgi:hypothetical protein